MSFDYTYSREQLRGLQALYRKESLYRHIDMTVAIDVLDAARKGKTEYFWAITVDKQEGSSRPTPAPFTNEEIIAALEDKFPGTHIEFQEYSINARPDLTLKKKGFLIDWS